ncbi:adenylate kinase isoenzyme 1-like [Bolinopsis microptera]|uniref:adenylate kinase isoenzyme 1-like n=1 Tax=Bolinopsis microptera TaxID=2820187 RepID=UPI003078CF68
MSGPKICFVIGGPGSGKGTQCEMLVQKFGVAHFSSGDLLRAEVASGSERGQNLSATMAEGKLVSMDVVIQLLREAVDKSFAEHPDKIILLDGFPREIEQATKFEEKICAATYVLSFECSQEEMTKRLLSRALTSGRVDDNIETIKKRLVTFETATAPVLEHYKAAGRLVNVSAEADKQTIFDNTCKGLGLC